jgi:hypothetical protein
MLRDKTTRAGKQPARIHASESWTINTTAISLSQCCCLVMHVTAIAPSSVVLCGEGDQI